MGTQPIDEYCREIETYLCRKNDGHLIRVVGPSFELVSGWAEQGVPLKIAFAGIDRYFERYYRKGPRRRPVKIDFCEADVLDVFDEWRRATGVQSSAASSARVAQSPSPSPPVSASLPAHLERVVLRLTSARAGGSLGDEFDALIDRAAAELDAARAKAGGLRGEARAGAARAPGRARRGAAAAGARDARRGGARRRWRVRPRRSWPGFATRHDRRGVRARARGGDRPPGARAGQAADRSPSS